MSKQTEALRLALEALEWMEDNEGLSFETEITAIKEALAEQDDPDLQDKDPELVEQHYKQVVDGVREVFDAKRKQPAQQQEPVSVMTVLHLKDRTEIGYGPASAGYDLPTGEYKLYTSPQPAQPWVGLTQEERDYIWHTVGNSDAHGDVDGWSGRDVMDAIEAKLREKNA